MKIKIIAILTASLLLYSNKSISQSNGSQVPSLVLFKKYCSTNFWNPKFVDSLSSDLESSKKVCERLRFPIEISRVRTELASSQDYFQTSLNDYLYSSFNAIDCFDDNQNTFYMANVARLGCSTINNENPSRVVVSLTVTNANFLQNSDNSDYEVESVFSAKIFINGNEKSILSNKFSISSKGISSKEAYFHLVKNSIYKITDYILDNRKLIYNSLGIDSDYDVISKIRSKFKIADYQQPYREILPRWENGNRIDETVYVIDNYGKFTVLDSTLKDKTSRYLFSKLSDKGISYNQKGVFVDNIYDLYDKDTKVVLKGYNGTILAKLTVEEFSKRLKLGFYSNFLEYNIVEESTDRLIIQYAIKKEFAVNKQSSISSEGKVITVGGEVSNFIITDSFVVNLTFPNNAVEIDNKELEKLQILCNLHLKGKKISKINIVSYDSIDIYNLNTVDLNAAGMRAAKILDYLNDKCYTNPQNLPPYDIQIKLLNNLLDVDRKVTFVAYTSTDKK